MIGTSERRAQLAADVAPVAVGQHQVEQHEVRARRARRRASASASVARDDRLEALARERARERLGDRRLVLDEEDAAGGRRRAVARGGTVAVELAAPARFSAPLTRGLDEPWAVGLQAGRRYRSGGPATCVKLIIALVLTALAASAAVALRGDLPIRPVAESSTEAARPRRAAGRHAGRPRREATAAPRHRRAADRHADDAASRPSPATTTATTPSPATTTATTPSPATTTATTPSPATTTATTPSPATTTATTPSPATRPQRTRRGAAGSGATTTDDERPRRRKPAGWRSRPILSCSTILPGCRSTTPRQDAAHSGTFQTPSAPPPPRSNPLPHPAALPRRRDRGACEETSATGRPRAQPRASARRPRPSTSRRRCEVRTVTGTRAVVRGS